MGVGTMIYLDANATVQPLNEVVDVVTRIMRLRPVNPSSLHGYGAEARVLLEQARDQICLLFTGAVPEGVIFTSGGTEGNNFAVRTLDGEKNSTIITSSVEHSSILVPVRHLAGGGRRLVELPVSTDGLIHTENLESEVTKASGSLLVSIQWANSETGVIQPIAEIVRSVRVARPDALVHVDAAQAVGRVKIDLDIVGADVLTFSGHKIHGPQGTGAIIVKDPSDRRIQPLLRGGPQESGLRAGTQNVPGIVGLGVAAKARAEKLDYAIQHMTRARDIFEAHVTSHINGAKVNGVNAPRLANTSNICFSRIEGTALLARLDDRGVMCSQGSACLSGRPEPSHVLTAMGLSEREAYSSLRFSFSMLNSLDEARSAAQIVIDTVRSMQ